jgi:hypothetical protein
VPDAFDELLGVEGVLVGDAELELGVLEGVEAEAELGVVAATDAESDEPESVESVELKVGAATADEGSTRVPCPH